MQNSEDNRQEQDERRRPAWNLFGPFTVARLVNWYRGSAEPASKQDGSRGREARPESVDARDDEDAGVPGTWVSPLGCR